MHEVIMPEVSQEPFAVKFPGNPFLWEPGYPLADDRDYFIVPEVARMLVKKNIIRRKDVDGIQQTRKVIREKDKMQGAHLFKNSKKYGYLIPKQAFAKYFFDMTAGESFIEENYADCLLKEKNYEWFFEMKEKEFVEKLANIKQLLDSDKLSDEDRKKLEKQAANLDIKIEEYKVLWLESVFQKSNN